MLPSYFAQVSEEAVRRVFGARFAAALFEARLGAWQGPIESAYGLHLVLIREEIPSQLQTPEETRTMVLAALLETTRQNATMASFSFTTTWFASMMHLTMADRIPA